MSHPSDKIASLIGARICHDLISPVGAVANGLELLELSGLPKSPELSLVTESADHASARIRLFRLAFGDAPPDQTVAGRAVAEILTAAYAGGRVAVTWFAPGDLPRPQVKLALLAVLCAEQALAAGGRVVVSHQAGGWRIRAAAARIEADPALWNMLRGGRAPENSVTPAVVQFLLLPQALAQAGLNCDAQVTDSVVKISF